MNAPIGVFDSGVGGLTVLRALISELPGEDFLYLGDTARLPYGTKSPETVARYSVRAAEALESRGIKALVVACNTASATSLPALRERFPSLPVIGVIEPGAQAACEAPSAVALQCSPPKARCVAARISAQSSRCAPEAHVTQVAAQVFVALAEEG
jgi:glutamate racemase